MTNILRRLVRRFFFALFLMFPLLLKVFEMEDTDVFQAFTEILEIKLFTFSDHTFTVGELLLIPTVVIVGLILTKWLTVFIARRMEKRGAAADAVHLVRRLVYVVALVVLFITTLDLINVPITAFAFVYGAVAIGFGFGAQNIINNFISGWILMWERPIRIDDFLEVDGVRGKVGINQHSLNTHTQSRRCAHAYSK